MTLLGWFNIERHEMDFICGRAAELREKYGPEAEAWCEARLASAKEPLERRTMKHLRRALKHVR